MGPTGPYPHLPLNAAPIAIVSPAGLVAIAVIRRFGGDVVAVYGDNLRLARSKIQRYWRAIGLVTEEGPVTLDRIKRMPFREASGVSMGPPYEVCLGLKEQDSSLSRFIDEALTYLGVPSGE